MDWTDVSGREWRGAEEHEAHLSVREVVDDHPERRETLVNLLGLLERLPARARLADLFGPGQIDEIQIPALLRPGVDVALMDADDKDRMRARGFGVHVGGADGACLAAGLHDGVYFCFSADVDVGETLDVDAARLVFVDGEVVVRRGEQVADPFHVDFHVADLDRVLDVGVRRGDTREYLLRDARDETLELGVLDIGAHHRKRLARSRLAVAKERAVEPHHDILHDPLDTEIENLNLGRRRGKDTVKAEPVPLRARRRGRRRGVGPVETDGGEGLVNVDAFVRVRVALHAVHRPEAAYDLDVVALGGRRGGHGVCVGGGEGAGRGGARGTGTRRALEISQGTGRPCLTRRSLPRVAYVMECMGFILHPTGASSLQPPRIQSPLIHDRVPTLLHRRAARAHPDPLDPTRRVHPDIRHGCIAPRQGLRGRAGGNGSERGPVAGERGQVEGDVKPGCKARLIGRGQAERKMEHRRMGCRVLYCGRSLRCGPCVGYLFSYSRIDQVAQRT